MIIFILKLFIFQTIVNGQPKLRFSIENLPSIDSTITEIFYFIDNIETEENKIYLSKSVLQICVKENFLASMEKHVKKSHDASTLKKDCAKKVLC